MADEIVSTAARAKVNGGARAGGAATSGSDAAPISEKPVPPPAHKSRHSTWTKDMSDFQSSGTPTSLNGTNRHSKMMDFHTSVDLGDYFVGPRNMDSHSKLPYFMRLHGSVTPRMILPLALVAGWSTAITCISKFVYPLMVNSVLLTVLGFVVGLALSFRSTTAYERYTEGRKAWATLAVHARHLARSIWVHIDERPEQAKEDLLSKVTAINLILAFAVSLKHKLRFEPYVHYPDIHSLVSHLDTFALAAHKPENTVEEKHSPWKAVGIYLGISFAESNPRKLIKRADRPLGNLPLEILTYISSYIEETSENGTLKSPVVTGALLSTMETLTDTQASAERVLTTPLPVGYNILISQIVLLYVYLLPFQLYSTLGWITIPGTIAAAYIILGLAAIGFELENPFGNDVNDLPLDTYCMDLASDLNVLTSVPAPRFSDVVRGCGGNTENKVLWPLSNSGFDDWEARTVQDIRSALKAKVMAARGCCDHGSMDGDTLQA
ncbi:hypothetical protein LZ554_005931 [Drepanopeziza brunnea f. sp. 'monogermtubi']|nr:hypothetical protein LZ554_005931 [Drepanopeziza brunnea f. sp. 'monogermtubi']